MISLEPNELGVAAISDALLQKQYMVAVTAYKRRGDFWEPLGSAEVLCENVGEVIQFAERALRRSGEVFEMTEIHTFTEDKIVEFFTMIDWSFVKRVEITKTADGKIWAKLIHYRSGKYMMHGLKHGWKKT